MDPNLNGYHMPMIFTQLIMQCHRKSQSNTVTKWILAILVLMAFGGFLSWGPSWPILIFIIFYMQTQVLSLAAPSTTFALCITTCCAIIDIDVSRLAIGFQKVCIIRLLQCTDTALYFASRIAHLLAAYPSNSIFTSLV